MYKRVLLKISGESISDKQYNIGISEKSLLELSDEIRHVVKTENMQLAIVIGAGNILRGKNTNFIERTTADYMGMLATVINALALQSVLESVGLHTRVMSAIEMPKIAEPYIRRRAMRHLEKGRVVIFAAGTGNPYFTTDTTAALRAIEIGAEILLKATQVDGVYDDDPKKNPKAKKYKTLTFIEAINKGLKIMDTTAFSLCMENNLPVKVFNLYKKGNLLKVLRGENVGTTIS
ncbi:MAG: UMP kinase [Endomicrobia bacterium]|nr:UMP kinase [Endomicrobiia bacterium]